MQHPVLTCLKIFLAEIKPQNRIWIALSGGVDSVVLLHSVQSLVNRSSIGAIHVNHQLSPSADLWQAHCDQLCLQWGIREFVSDKVTVESRGEGVEQAARAARYAAFSRTMQSGDVLLLGHHQQDQVETVLFRLARGAGLKGLSGMPQWRQFASGHLGRPFLNLPKGQILHYAEEHRLSWVEDESNSSDQFDRNFIRNNAIPALQSRWPQVQTQIAQAAECLREADGLLNEYLAVDFKCCGCRSERVGSSILLDSVASVSHVKCNALIRYWLGQLGYRSPTKAQMEQFQGLLNARQDRSPLLHWGDCELRRFRDRIYCLPAHWQERMNINQTLIKAVEESTATERQSMQIFLSDVAVAHELDHLQNVSAVEELKRAHPSNRQHSQTMKKLWQEYGVEPWLRPYWPVLLRNDKLVAVVGLWLESSAPKEWTDVKLDWTL